MIDRTLERTTSFEGETKETSGDLVAKRRAPGSAGSVLSFLRANSLIAVFAVLVLIGALTSEYFLSPLNIANLLRSMAVPGLLAVGMTFVLLVARIDLSVGSLMIFVPILGVSVMDLCGDLLGFRVLVRGNSFVGSSAVLIGLALVTGPFIGFLSGLGVVYGRITAFIMTLAMMQALRGLNYVLTNGHAFYLQADTYTWIGKLSVFGVPFSFLVFLLATVIAGIILKYTVVGQRLRAIGGDEKAAQLAGVNTRFWIITTFVVCGFFAALAGVLFTSRLQSVDAPLAVGFELTAIAMAVVGGVSLAGGRGSPYRAFLGALVISTMINVFSMWGLSTWYQNIAMGAIVILVVMADRIISKRTAES